MSPFLFIMSLCKSEKPELLRLVDSYGRPRASPSVLRLSVVRVRRGGTSLAEVTIGLAVAFCTTTSVWYVCTHAPLVFSAELLVIDCFR